MLFLPALHPGRRVIYVFGVSHERPPCWAAGLAPAAFPSALRVVLLLLAPCVVVIVTHHGIAAAHLDNDLRALDAGFLGLVSGFVSDHFSVSFLSPPRWAGFFLSRLSCFPLTVYSISCFLLIVNPFFQFFSCFFLTLVPRAGVFILVHLFAHGSRVPAAYTRGGYVSVD